MKSVRKATTPTCIVVANWKMNPGTIDTAKELFLAVKKEASRRKRVQTIVAAPFVYLTELHKLVTSSRINLCAQDIFWEIDGTYTGEISAPMLVSVGVSHAIIGHSERRALGENDEEVAQKVATTIKGGLTVILCIGESARDSTGAYLSVIENQLRTACRDLRKGALKSIVIAYEPIWAISDGDGKGQTALPSDVYEMSIFIRKVLTSMYDRPSAERVPILYGGSVSGDNASALMRDGMVDGFLVGGASLKAQAFASILTAVNEH